MRSENQLNFALFGGHGTGTERIFRFYRKCTHLKNEQGRVTPLSVRLLSIKGGVK